MDDGRPLHERVDALERAVTDGHADDGLPDAARMAARVDDLETTVEGMDDRVAELEAAIQALRGFAGGIQAVDEAVERRADAAVARVDRLETELEELRNRVDDADDTVDSGAGPNGRAVTGDRSEGTGTDPDAPTPRGGRDAGSGRAMDGSLVAESDHGDGHDGSLTAEVAARSDAALADAAAMADHADADEERSLAERIRRLL